MGFSKVWFSCFGFFRRVCCLLPVHVRKRKSRLKPATAAHFFDRFRRVVSGTRVKQEAATR
jgi:hypothetical protein